MSQWVVAALCTVTSTISTLYIFHFAQYFLNFIDKEGGFRKWLFYIGSIFCCTAYMVFFFPVTPFYMVPIVLYGMFFCVYRFCFAGNLRQHIFLAGFSTYIITAFRGAIYAFVCLVGGKALSAVFDSLSLNYMVSATANLVSVPFMYLVINGLSTSNIALLLNMKRTLRTINVVTLSVIVIMSYDATTMMVRGETGYISLFQLIIHMALLLLYYIALRYFALVDAINGIRLDAYEQQLKLQLEHYTMQSAYNESFKRLRHDYKAQLSGLQTLVNKGDVPAAQAFLNELIGKFDFATNKMTVYSNDVLIDAIMQKAAVDAGKIHADFSANVQMKGKLHIKDIDVCSIFSNILRNAVEACTYVEDGKRFIHVISRVKGNNLVVQEENSYDGVLLFEAGEYITRKKQDASMHGIGLQKIREIVEDVGCGSLSIKADKDRGVFSLTLLLPLINQAPQSEAVAEAPDQN